MSAVDNSVPDESGDSPAMFSRADEVSTVSQTFAPSFLMHTTRC